MAELSNAAAVLSPAPAKAVPKKPRRSIKIADLDGRRQYVQACLVARKNPQPWIRHPHVPAIPTFKERLFAYQQAEIETASLHTRLLLQVSPRCGKTRAGLGSLLRARADRQFGRSIIFCPNAIVDVWIAECALWGVTPVVIGAGGRDGKSRTIKESIEMLQHLDEDALVLCNDERVEHLAQPLIDARFDGIIVDESHRIISLTSIRGEIIRECAARATWVRFMTGTPIANSPMDIWAQCSVLRPDIWGDNQDIFADLHLINSNSKEPTIANPAMYARMSRACIHGYAREDIFAEILAARAMENGGTVATADNWQYINRFIYMPPAAVEAYNSVAAAYDAWMQESQEANHSAKGFAIQMQARQITSGFLHPQGSKEWKDLHYAKTNAVLADIEEPLLSGEKVVIFHLFVEEGKRFMGELHKRYPDMPLYEMNGTVHTSHYDACVQFNNHNGPAVIVAQIQSASLGLPMHTANHIMFTSKTWRYIDLDQARDRIFSAGQMKTITSYVVPDTIDMSIEEALARRSNLHMQTVAIARIAPATHGISPL